MYGVYDYGVAIHIHTHTHMLARAKLVLTTCHVRFVTTCPSVIFYLQQDYRRYV